MGQIERTRVVEALHQPLVELVAGVVAKADQIEQGRDDELEIRVALDPAGEFAGERNVAANVAPQTLDPVVPDHEPELERAKTASERHLPVAIVHHRTRLGRRVAQIIGQHREGVDQGGAVGDIEAVAVEVCQQPLVWVEAVAVGSLDAFMHPAQFGTDCGAAG